MGQAGDIVTDKHGITCTYKSINKLSEMYYKNNVLAALAPAVAPYTFHINVQNVD